MAKLIHYHFDPETSRYSRVKVNMGSKLLRAAKTICLATGIAIIMVIVFSFYFELPRELMLKEELAVLEFNFKKMDSDLTNIHEVMQLVEGRDDNVYRILLGAEPVSKSVREGGVGGSLRNTELREQKLKYGDLMISLLNKISKLRRQLYVELRSQDELLTLARSKQNKYESIPAIQPLANQQLTAFISGFGLRMHPVYKVIRMHEGIDFSAPVGSPVYATADGRVVAMDTAVQGYGKRIIIDHGYGYQTRYAHLDKFVAKVGDMVTRGEHIAYTGNTGVSTSPHLHYEVLLNGAHINPVHFFFNDLGPVEYERMIALASKSNQSLGN